SGTSTVEVELEGRRLKLSNLDKVLYPESAFTKGQVIDYYVRVSSALLPHLHRRPLTLKRYPNGVDAGFFYEKQCPSHRPDWVHTVEIPSERTRGKTVNYCMADDLPTLAWLANLAAIELHPLLAQADGPHNGSRDAVNRPTMVAFDLDPGLPADVTTCAQVACWLREVLDELGLASFPKTSGSKGLQVYVPLNTPHTYEDTKPFAHAIARLLEKHHPDHALEKMDKSLRRGKVLIDWSQNHITKTTICAYSLRARPEPTVSTPLSWEEVEGGRDADGARRLHFEANDVLERLDRYGDLFAPVLELEQHLPRIG
ncbi:MAG TPA: non-homologous end-joining DNA ligase, partial [Acidimicrobiales bacterium]|nr:non-homologous end-joining DNA ligase [Acidimicrobiales bacterium]